MFRVCQLFQLVSFLQATFACSSPACWETATGRAVCAWLWQIHTHSAHTVYVGNILDMQWQMIFWKYSRPKNIMGLWMRTGLFVTVQLSSKRAEKSFTLDMFLCCSQPLNVIYHNTERAFVWDGPVDTCFPWEQWISSASFKKYLPEERVMSH